MYKVIIMNANGCVPKGLKIGGMEIPMKKKAVRQEVIQVENPDFILIQESNIVLKDIFTQYFVKRDYQSIGGKDAGIIYDKTRFSVREDPTYRLLEILRSKGRTRELLSGEILTEMFVKMCARILLERHLNAQPFLLVSWHGPYKMSQVNKKNLYIDLLLLIRTYIYEKQIPVILGGDFNLNLSKISPTWVWPSPHRVFHNMLLVHDYMKLEYRPNKIDYILTSQTIIEVRCEPVDTFSFIEKLFPDLPKKFWKAVLDHNPLAVNVTIPNHWFWYYHSYLKM